MFEDITERESNYILEFQRAADGHIFPNLRLISITIQSKIPDLFFFFDGPISEDDLESLNLIDTYFRSNCPETFIDGEWVYTRIDYPQPILNIPGECVYARKESPLLIQPKRGVLIEPWMDRWTKICIALRRAMINNVFSQIRLIGAAYTESKATIHVIMDGSISGDDQKSLELMKNYFALQFPANEMLQCDLTVTRVDFPQTIPNLIDALVYIRKERPELSGYL